MRYELWQPPPTPIDVDIYKNGFSESTRTSQADHNRLALCRSYIKKRFDNDELKERMESLDRDEKLAPIILRMNDYVRHYPCRCMPIWSRPLTYPKSETDIQEVRSIVEDLMDDKCQHDHTNLLVTVSDSYLAVRNKKSK